MLENILKIILGYSIVFLTILNNSIFLSSVFKKKIAKCIPLSIMISMIIMFIFGLVGSLKLSVYIIVIGFNLIGICTILYKIIKKEFKELVKNVFTRGMVIYFFMYWIFALVLYKRVSQFWDEYTFWSIANKNMYVWDSFITNSHSTILGATYPPLPTLFQYFVCKVVGRYSQGIELFASVIFGISLLIPLLEDNKKKSFSKIASLIFIIIAIPTIFCSISFYEAVYVDALLGIIIGYLLYSYFNYEKDAFYYLNNIVIAIVLALVKPTGIVVLLILIASLLLYCLIDNIEQNKKFSIKSILKDKAIYFAVLMLIAGIIAFGLWQIHLKTNVKESIMPEESIASYEGNPIKYLVKVFAKAVVNGSSENELEQADIDCIKTAPEHLIENNDISNNYIKISAIGWIILFVLFAIYIYKKISSSEDKRKFKNYMIATIIGYWMYIAFLQVAYMLVFKNVEAVKHSSAQRYIGSYLMAIMIYLIYTYIDYMKKDIIMDHKSRYIVLMLIVAMFTPFNYLGNITINYQTYNLSENNKIAVDRGIAEKISEKVSKDEKIYIIHQTGDYDTHGVRYRYFLTPIMTSYYKTINSQTDRNELVNKISEYDYVFVIHTDEYLNNNYNDLFEQDNIKELTLYKITKENEENIKLNPVNMEE